MVGRKINQGGFPVTGPAGNPGDPGATGPVGPVGPPGTGDMTKAVYDTNNNGKVDAAESADVAVAVAWTGVSGKPATFAPAAHTHVAADISNSTAVGRAVLTAVDAATARTAIGAGTGNGDVTLAGVQTLTNKALTTPVATGLREVKAVAVNNFDMALANLFTRTISGAATFTVSNVPATGTVATFILDLTNGGSAAITWWSGVKWAGGTAPTLTAAGRDVLGFFTHDGGTVWTGLLLGKDVK